MDAEYFTLNLRRINIAVFQRDVYRSPLYNFNRATSTDEYVNWSTEKCDVFSTYTLRSRRGLDDLDVTTILGGCLTRPATINEVTVVFSIVATAERSPPKTKPTFTQRQQRKAITQSRSDAITKRFANVASDPAATWRVMRDVLHRGKQQ